VIRGFDGSSCAGGVNGAARAGLLRESDRGARRLDLIADGERCPEGLVDGQRVWDLIEQVSIEDYDIGCLLEQ
jgi:hypothetical protein